MPHSIDVAWFECIVCGHRCTAPTAVNGIPHQMDIHSVHDAKADLTAKLAEMQAKHKGNTITVANEGDGKVIRFARSYADVKLQSDLLDLANSDHVILSCPQCAAHLYEVTFKHG